MCSNVGQFDAVLIGNITRTEVAVAVPSSEFELLSCSRKLFDVVVNIYICMMY
jgi:hypothetical protein